MAYVLPLEILLQQQLPPMQTTELVDLVLVLAADLDLVCGLLVFLGELRGGVLEEDMLIK